jgi:hypothetical protein
MAAVHEAVFLFTGCKNVTAAVFPAPAGKRHKAAVNSCCLDSGGKNGQRSARNLACCPMSWLRRPMQPNGAAPVTRELDDISYVCPKCGAETKRTMKRA